MTYNFQYQNQFVDKCNDNITQQDQRRNVKFTDNNECGLVQLMIGCSDQ